MLTLSSPPTCGRWAGLLCATSISSKTLPDAMPERLKNTTWHKDQRMNQNIEVRDQSVLVTPDTRSEMTADEQLHMEQCRLRLELAERTLGIFSRPHDRTETIARRH